MAPDPIGEMRARMSRRFRWFTVYHAILVAFSVALVGWIVLPSQSSNLLWAFVFIAIVMPIGVPLVWWMNRRGYMRIMDALEAFRPRVRDAKVSLGAGYLLILDNGLVFAADPRTNALRFVAFLSAGGAVFRPDVRQAERWVARIRGMQTEGAITQKKGPPEAQAVLDQLRQEFGAKFYYLFLREVRSDRMAPGEPMWHLVLGFFVPRWWDRAKEIAAGVDRIASFLETAKDRYFPRGATAA